MRNIEFANRVAVITGATSDIGLALAVRAAQQGMKVAIVDRDQERLAVALKRVSEKEPRSIALHMELSDVAEVRKLARCTEVELGPPWLVCNTCESSAELNLRAVADGAQVFAPILAERGDGHIVNIISADFLDSSCSAVSAAALHAIVGISESLYRELDSLGSRVGVSVVCPASTGVDFRILGTQFHNRVTHSVRPHAGEVLRPERLAEEIFGAVRTRRFRVFSDGPQTSGVDAPARQRSEDALIRHQLSDELIPSWGQRPSLIYACKSHNEAT
jgi:short-subunit dehydrogenase